MSLLQSVSSVEAVTQTGYGAIWGIKMLLVLLLIGIAVWNRIAVTPMLHTGGRMASLWLRRNVFIEIALVIAVLTLTATFALTPPPRTLPQFAPTIPVPNPSIGYSTVVTSGGWTALIDVVPARTGSNRIQILLTDADGHNRTAGLISEWTQATDAHTSEPIVITHDPEMIGVITLPSSGRWRVRLRWTDSDDRTHVLRFSVPIPSNPAATHGEAS